MERLLNTIACPAIALLLLCLVSTAGARIITVDNDAPADFNNIQAAIDDANDGDTVEIQPGRYTGPGNRDIDFKGKAITVRSTDPNDPNIVAATIIDCNGQGRGFYFLGSRNGPGCVVNGLTIMNSNAIEGGGICCDEYASPTIRACRIMGNSAGKGGGVYIGNGSTAVIDRCLITQNSVDSLSYQGEGGGIFCSVSSDALISNCIVSNNQASGSYESHGDGGGLYLSNCPATVRHCTIVDNTAGVAGGISCNRFANHIISNCIVWGNGTADSAQIVGTPSVSYSNVQGGYPGNANTNADPWFVDPSAGDYHLSTDSPCRDSGDPIYFNTTSGDTDIDGEPRVMGPRTDRGADEFTDEVLEMPIVEVSPTEFVFEAVESGLDPEPQMLTVRNIGLGTLRWQIHHDNSWLGSDPNAGQCAGDPNHVTLSIYISTLSWGSYECELIVEPETSANGSRTIIVNLHIRRQTPLLVPAEYGSIQQAINAAAWGDTIIVSPGTYHENIHFLGKNLTLTSEDPYNPNTAADTVIQGNGTVSVVAFAGTENTACHLVGFTITGGHGTEPGYGGGIQGNGTTANINNCIIKQNSAYRRGGGLFDCDGPITNCAITENSVSSPASAEGAGLHSCDGPITNCTISYNTSGTPSQSGFGGGLYNCQGPITGCAIIGNSAGGNGGGLFDCDGPISYCNIVANAARHQWTQSRGGGLYRCDGNITECSVTDNIALESGGGFYQCRGIITDCLISANKAIDYDGGGLRACESITKCVVSGNFAGSNGGGVSECSSIRNSVIIHNTAGANGGALHNPSELINCTVAANHAGARGGAVYVQSSATASNCIFWDNTAAEGNGIYLDTYVICGRGGCAEIPSSMEVYFSNVQAGEAAATLANGCTLNWHRSNINEYPYFVDPANGDYHLKSRGWRWDKGRKVWTWDEVTSRCIDAGNPGSPLANEPLSIPGDPTNYWGRNLRINMGAFGGTPEASIPPRNWALLSDITNDGLVNFDDFASYAANFPVPAEGHPGDFDRNAVRDLADLPLLAEEWLDQTGWCGKSPPPPPPGQAWNPNPPYGSVGIRTDPVLSWVAGASATSHDVYFGKTSPGTFRGNQNQTTFTPGSLAYETTYYWRIDEVNADGKTAGPVWSFTTKSSGTR